jgi:MOSC domain-containing protein YiiM
VLASAGRLARTLGCTFTVSALVLSVHSKASHSFSKDPVSVVELVEGHGVVGDAHFGITVKHRSRVAKDPTQPNLRQVHLLHQELLDELTEKGLNVAPGQLGENITTSGLPLLSLSEGTILRIGPQAVVRITGLRNPCAQIENFKPGLLAAVLDRTPEGELVRKAGVMGIVLVSGLVSPRDPIEVVATPDTHSPLKPV